MDGRVPLLIGLVLLAGCAGEPIGDTPTSTSPVPSSPVPSPVPSPVLSPPWPTPPPETGQVPPTPFAPDREVFSDSFDEDPREGTAWRYGFANDREVNFQGRAEWVPGAVRIAVPTMGDLAAPPAYGLIRDVEVGDERVVLEARVRGHTIYRFGLYLASSDGEKTSIEMDRDWFCLCADARDEWQTTTFHPNVVAGADHHLRLTLARDGSALVQVYDQGMMLVASQEAVGLDLQPHEVDFAGFAVWVDDEHSPGSDYTVFYTRLTRGA